MKTTARDLIQILEEFAPPDIAEEWDNVGLLLGNPGQLISSVMTCLTLTPDVAKEAIDRGAGLVITHHPILFRAVKKLTAETLEGEMLIKLVRAEVAVYSPHTSFDNAEAGINQWLADRLELANIAPLRRCGESGSLAVANSQTLGAGRFGNVRSPQNWADFRKTLFGNLKLPRFQSVPPQSPSIERVGIACGAAAEFLSDADRAGCNLFITGEARFHDCLEARGRGIGLVLLGHYASERPALEMLAERVAGRFPHLTVWASTEETDPITWEMTNPN